LGIDGLSIGPILLTGFITTLTTLVAQPVTRNFHCFFIVLSIVITTYMHTKLEN